LQLAWIGRRGTQLETLGPPGNYRGIDLSADGGRVALHRHDGNGGDVWIMDLSGRATKLTFDATQDNSAPIWSPDGTRIAYATLRNGKWAIFQQPANNTGTDERLVDSDRATVPVSWPSSPDAIVYDIVDAKTLTDLWLLPFTGDRKPVPVVNNPGSQSHGQVSPDGKWLVYQSIESGRNEVYVQQFPSGSGKVQVSTQGGVFPRWRRDGRELFFMSQTSGGKMMAVEVNPSGSAFEAATPTELFDSGYVNISHAVPRYHPYVVSPDGQRFLIPRPVAATGSTELPIVVVENWREELKQR
jgi:Tol biopolymer transport system component